MAKVVFVNRFFHPDTSATSQLLTDLATALADAGREVTVITSRQLYCDAANRTLPAVDRHRGVEIRRVWSTRFGRGRPLGRLVDYLSFYLSASVALLWNVARNDVVVAKTDPPLISVLAGIAAFLKGAKLVNWLQDLFPEVATQLQVKGAKPLSPLLIWLRNRSLKQATINVVLGESMAKVVRRQGVADARIVEIHNWCDEGIAPIAREENALRAALGYTASDLVVGYSGNMGQCHDIETIVDAMVLLKHHPKIKFVFFGDGAKRRLVADAIERHQLTNVSMHGYRPREELALSLSVPDVHLVSQLPAVEGCMSPSKLYGVLAVGRPVVHVGDECGEVAQLIERLNVGAVAASGNSARLSEALSALGERSDLAELGRRAREASVRQFSRAISLYRWFDVIERTARVPEAGPPSQGRPAVVPQAALARATQ